MKEKKEKQDKKKSTGMWVFSLFNGQPGSASYCTPDQCFITNQQSFSTTSLIAPINPDHKVPPLEWNNSTQSALASSINLYELFPSELIQLIKDAAQQGLLISVLITLVNEGATDYLKNLQYSPDKIYWINQGIRSLLLIALGSSAGIALATPIASFALHSFGGFSKENSNYLTTGVVLGINLLTNPMSMVEASIALSTSVGSSFLGSKIAQSGYNFLRSTFFQSEHVEETQENELQSPKFS